MPHLASIQPQKEGTLTCKCPQPSRQVGGFKSWEWSFALTPCEPPGAGAVGQDTLWCPLMLSHPRAQVCYYFLF